MKRYGIDWSDAHYPAIKPYEEGAGLTGPQTFAEAKAEIVDFYQNQLDFARLMIKQTRTIRAADIQAGN